MVTKDTIMHNLIFLRGGDIPQITIILWTVILTGSTGSRKIRGKGGLFRLQRYNKISKVPISLMKKIMQALQVDQTEMILSR